MMENANTLKIDDMGLLVNQHPHFVKFKVPDFVHCRCRFLDTVYNIRQAKKRRNLPEIRICGVGTVLANIYI
jgi:hypothetical protein